MSDGSFRCFLGAPIDEATVVRLKRIKAIDRARDGRSLVVLHFIGPEGPALEREMARRLSVLPDLLVVASDDPGVAGSARRIEAVIEQLPDGLRASLGGLTILRAADPLELETRMAEALRAELTHAR